MPSFYGTENVVASALQGFFGGMDRRAQQRREDDERRIERERQAKADASAERQAAVGRALQRYQMQEMGIREGAAPSNTGLALPVGMGGLAMVPDQRYTDLGEGLYVDRNATPRFRETQAAQETERKALAQREALNAAIGQALQDPDPSTAVQRLIANGMSPAEAKTTIEASRAPDPKAPVMGSPEWEKAYRKQKQIDAEFSPRAAGGAGGAGGGQPMADSGEIMKWRGEFAKLTANERAAADGFARIKAATAKGVDKMTATDDIGLIYGFMKVQDPGSTVREGEYATAEQAAGIPARVLQLYNKAKDGQKLTPAMRQQFLQTATQGAEQANESVRRRATEMIPTLTRMGVNPSDVIVSPFSGLLGGAEKPRAASQRPVAGGDTANKTAVSLDRRIQQAYDAIASGEDEATVRRKFRALTGKELPR